MVENKNEINFDDNKPYLAPHYPFSLEGHWQPWYDDRRDYNTNAPTYYDYLSNFNKLIKDITELLNRVARRNIEVEDTNCVDLTKINDWIDEGNTCHTYHDVITLKADVILSTYQKAVNFDSKDYKLTNSISCLTTGLYAPDYLPLLNALSEKLNQEIQDKKDADDTLKQYIDNKASEITNNITNINNQFKDLEDKLNQEIQNRKDADDELRNLIQATIQPSLVTTEFEIIGNKLTDNGLNPPDKRHGIDFGKVLVNAINKTYEYFKVGISGYTFNFSSGDKVLRCSLSTIRQAGVTESMIYQAQQLNWSLIDGYYQNNNGQLDPIEWRISGDDNYLYIEAHFNSQGEYRESNSNHVVMNIS